MIHGSIWDKILLFAVPLALTSMLQQLFNAADIAVIGQFCGKNAMAAVGCSSPIVGLMLNLFNGIALGSNVIISRFTGARSGEKVIRAVHTSMTVAFVMGIFIMGIGELLAYPLLSVLSVPDEIWDMAILYLRIYFAGMPVIVLYNFEAAIFRSQGDTRTPLICLTISGVANVALNLFFVLVLNMNVEGVALATVIANVISAGLLFILLLKHDGLIRVHRKQLGIDRPILRQIVLIGLPAGIQGMAFPISNMVMQSGVNSLGTDVIAGSAAAFNIEIFCFFILNAFGQACTTFVGQNYGAGDYPRCKRVTRLSLVMGIIATLAIAVLILVFGRVLLLLFNQEPSVIAAGYTRLVYIAAWQFLNAANDILSGALRGYGRSTFPAIMSILGICVSRIIWMATVFQASRTYPTLLLAYPISWAITLAAITFVYFLTKKNQLNKEFAK